MNDYNGALIGTQVMKSISENRKADAVKMLRKMPTINNTTEGRWSISLWDSKLFIEAIIAGQPTSEEVERQNYKKLRNAGFDVADVIRIIEALR